MSNIKKAKSSKPCSGLLKPRFARGADLQKPCSRIGVAGFLLFSHMFKAAYMASCMGADLFHIYPFMPADRLLGERLWVACNAS